MRVPDSSRKVFKGVRVPRVRLGHDFQKFG